MIRLNGTSFVSEIKNSLKLSSGNELPTQVQFLRTGSFNHPRYGAFTITSTTLQEMKMNFDNKVRGIDMSLDYYHNSDQEASGWVTGLELKENDTELWGEVKWTPKAAQMLSDREIRYFSPDFAFNWVDPETKSSYNNVLFGGGLTNRPFIKEMQAIVAHEKTGDIIMTELEKLQAKVKELEGQNLKLSEAQVAAQAQLAAAPAPSKVSELEAKIAELQKELEAEKAKSGVALADKVKAEEAAKLAEKTNDFNILLSEGKACAAQKDAFIKGDMSAFAKLAQPVNLKANGSGASGDQNAGAVTHEQVIKLAEEKQKANPKLQRGDAISIARKELKYTN